MAKKKVQFETFNDGACDFWQLDEKRNPVKSQGGIRFQKRVVGYKRNYTAEQAGHKVEMLIRIPQTSLVRKGYFAVIEGQQYQVAQAQNIWDTIPECTDITLEQPDILLEFNENEAGSGGRF